MTPASGPVRHNIQFLVYKRIRDATANDGLFDQVLMATAAITPPRNIVPAMFRVIREAI